jgi:hypothetical protein
MPVMKKCNVQGVYRIIPFYTQGVALGWAILGFQPFLLSE